MFRFDRRLRRRNLLWGEASEGGRSPPPSYLGAVVFGSDEGRDPAVAQAPRALLGRLALAADPDGRRILPRLREDRHAIELEELTLVGDFVLGPEEAEDLDGLVRAPAALLEGHAGGVELARELDAHPDGGKEPPA